MILSHDPCTPYRPPNIAGVTRLALLSATHTAQAAHPTNTSGGIYYTRHTWPLHGGLETSQFITVGDSTRISARAHRRPVALILLVSGPSRCHKPSIGQFGSALCGGILESYVYSQSIRPPQPMVSLNTHIESYEKCQSTQWRWT